MKNITKCILSLLMLAGAFAACRKDPSPTPAVTGNMALAITNTADSNILALNKNYKDANGDSISISIFNYYISNIVLTDNNGKTFSEPYSYHLVIQSIAGSSNFIIPNVPSGTYTSITFLIGVDSLHNVSGAQTGALSPVTNEGMFWSWNTGYVMAEMEGIVVATNHNFQLHIGGFSSPYNALRTVTLNFPQPLVIATNGQGTAFLHANALSWFKAPHLIDLNTFPSTQSPNSNAVTIADNYANMFGIDSVK